MSIQKPIAMASKKAKCNKRNEGIIRYAYMDEGEVKEMSKISIREGLCNALKIKKERKKRKEK